MRYWWFACLLLAGCATPVRTPSPERIAVVARPIPLNAAEPGQTTVGRLHYLGGLHLASPDRRFGGLSGLRWDGEALVAVSDQGDFLRLRPIETGARLVGIAEARIVRLTDPAGRPLGAKRAGDAEALELHYGHECGDASEACAPQFASVAFEQRHRVWGYDLRGGMPTGRPRVFWQPEDHGWFAALPANAGIEALADLGDMISVAIAEDGGASGASEAVLYHNGGGSDASAAHRQRAAFRFGDGFRPTDAVFGETLLVLSRFYEPGRGSAARIHSIALKPTDDSAILAIGEPQLVAELAPPLAVDNMEGIAVRREDGRIFLYIVSDDNLSSAQRTLLLKFELLN